MEKIIVIDNEETNYTINEQGVVQNLKTGRFLKGTYARNEYHNVQLIIKGKPRSFLTHRLVAEAFIPNPNNYTVVHHKDENKLNNSVDNLEWINPKIHIAKSFTNKSGRTKTIKGGAIDIPEIGEEWQLIKGAESYLISRDGKIFSLKNNKLLTLSYRNGYLRVTLNKTTKSIHRLVYETFVGEITDGVIDHIDGDRSNNKVENLRNVTQSTNMKRAQELGHHGQTKVMQKDKDGNMIHIFNSFTEAAKAFGVTYSAISSAAKRNGTSCGYYWEII